MLEEFTVDNYKSLINVTFRPKKLNLLLGMNNAGKTNLSQAITFLAATSRMPLAGCADTVSGLHQVKNLYFEKPTIDFHVEASVPFESEKLKFHYELTLSMEALAEFSRLMEVESEKLSLSGGGFDEVVLLENSRQGVRLLHETDYLRGNTHYVETTAPRDATMLSRLYDLKSNPRTNCFKNYLASWQYYSLSAEALRSNQHHPDQRILQPDGANLASVVHGLKMTDERCYRDLVKSLRLVAPEIDVINFRLMSDLIAMHFEDSHGNSLSAKNASSGTLRFLALLYILTTRRPTEGCPVIIVEEPENGLYVGVLKELVEILKKSESGPQVIFTSHSPYFIDLFDDRLDSIFIMKRGERHSSITQPDVQQTEKRLERYPLGEQHFREMLG